MLLRKNYFLMLITIILLTTFLFSGCFGLPSDNGKTPAATQTPSETGEQTGEPLDMMPYYLSSRGYMENGRYAKMELWQKVDGVESEGWFSMDIAVDGDTMTLTLDGVLGEVDLSAVYVEDGLELYSNRPLVFALDLMQRESHPLQYTFYNMVYTPLEEYFSVIETIGESTTFYLPQGFEHSVPGFDSYTMGEGLTFVRTYEDTVVFETCISPLYPINLYIYIAEVYLQTEYDPDANQYRMELVEYRSE